jgi:phosphopantothenoylcysteine decarboxylase/phosphopantothenate--cysteine ligase
MTLRILHEKQIILGVSGSIAAYKSIDLASKLTQHGALVETILTESAQRFVTSLSFQSVTGRSASANIWEEEEHVKHVRLGETADLFVIAPATAHTIAKLAHGLADNLLCVTALASRCPLLIAPAMDGGMYQHDATQDNLKLLRSRGAIIIEPAEGRMASGLTGKGRMVEPVELVGHIRKVLGRGGNLKNRKIVVSAGPTQEPIDPVRFLSNRSSGRQGFALAQAALDAGAAVTLVAGPSALEAPVGAEIIHVKTAAEMCEAILSEVNNADALLMAAAVADFRPENPANQKIKKTADKLRNNIPLIPNADILLAVKEQRQKTGWPLISLGFAAETQNVIDFGKEKLKRKGLDYIAINDVSDPMAGFSVDTNQVTLVSNQGIVYEIPVQSKTNVSERIIDVVSQHLASGNTANSKH